MSNVMHIWTDGACSGNPGPGGYSAIAFGGPRPMCICGSIELTTNNRMELIGFIEALRYYRDHRESFSSLVVHTDSKYVVNPIVCGWLKKWIKADFAKKKNADLWRIVDELLCEIEITIEWVKGHSGIKENDLADSKAVEAMNFCWPLSTIIEL